MTDKEQRQLAEWILEQVGASNPYGRSFANKRSEYYIYQSGFIAAYLASLMREDPFVYRRFKQHVESKRKRK